MKYKVDFTSTAWNHMDFWKKSGQKKILKKIWLLVEELKLHPQTGTGQVEQLRGNLSGFWSRRIDKETEWSIKLKKTELL